MKKDRIIHVLNRYQNGAISNIVRDIATILRSYYQFEVWSYEKVENSLNSERFELSYEITLRDFESERKVGVGWYKIARELDHCRPQIVHFHGGRAGAIGPFLARYAKVPVIINTVHNVRGQYNPVIRQLMKISFKFVNTVVCVSNSVERSFFDSVNQEHAIDNDYLPDHLTIHNGVDVEKINDLASNKNNPKLPFNNNVPLIVNIGRLVRQKDQSILLEGFNLLLKEDSDMRLLVLGKGQMKEDLIRKCREMHIYDKVSFFGYRDDALEILNAADLFVSTSLWEGLPLSHLEAMALGKPIVATSISSVEEIITDEEEGLLVKPGDPEGLKESMKTLLESRKKANKLGNNAKEKVKKYYDTSVMAEGYHKLYQKLLEQPCID